MTTWTPAGVQNDVGVILTNALHAAERIHVVMARLDHDHGVQGQLNEALHNTLIVAEQCRQVLGSLSAFPKPQYHGD